MINYITKGDATYPELITPDKNNLIVHIVNDIGGWGAGFVLALSRRWTKPEYFYRANWKSRKLGDIDIIQVEKNICVVNLVGQHGVMSSKTNSNLISLNPFTPKTKPSNAVVPPVRYEAIEQGLISLRRRIGDRKDVAVHMPKIGCGLAGGKWEIVEKIINDILFDIDVYVHLFD